MNYEPNTIDWQKGDFVLHDADAKEQHMLMVIMRYDDKKKHYISRYVFPEKIGGETRKIYRNRIEVLHDPAKFDVKLPTSKELKDRIVEVQQHSFYVYGCMNVNLMSFCPCSECGYWNGVYCESEDPEHELDIYQIVMGRWEIKKFDIPHDEILLDVIPKEEVFMGKDIQAIKEIKEWLEMKIMYMQNRLEHCDIGSKEEGYFLQKLSFYKVVLSKVNELKVEEGSE